MPPRRDAPPRQASGGPNFLYIILSFVCGFLTYSFVQQFQYTKFQRTADSIARDLARASATSIDLSKESSLAHFTQTNADGSPSTNRPSSESEKTSAAPSTVTIVPSEKATPSVSVPVITAQEGPKTVQPGVNMAGFPLKVQVLPEGYPLSYSNLRLTPMYPIANVKVPSSINNAEYKLTAERVGQYADGQKRIMVTWANRHYMDFVLNWVEHVRTAGIANYIVGAMDDSLLRELVARGIPCFAMSSGLTENDFGWGTKNFHKMGREKIKLIYMFASLGYTSVISDVDTVWLRDPFVFFDRFPEADILTSSDHLHPTHERDDMPEDPFQAGHSAMNIGIMYMKPSTAALAKEWNEMLDRDDNIWDQNAFNDLFRRGMNVVGSRENKNLFKGYGGQLLLGVLPVSVFCSGHTYFVSNWAGQYNLQPYVVHATFQYSGTEGKRHRFRERLLWSDQPDYFEGRFLYYDPKIDQEALRRAVPTRAPLMTPDAVPHIQIVHQQVREIRSMYQIAQITGRILILPPIYCALDRWWAPHDGSIPGAETKLPFICPADHVIAIERLSPRDANVFGPDLTGFREYSFLKNPRTPKAILEDKFVLRVCAEGNDACANQAATGAGTGAPIVVIDQRLDETNMLEVLNDYKDKKLMVLEKPSDVFLFYSDKKKYEMFERRFYDSLGIWCCTRPEKPGRPGHVWYDPFFDVPHRDRNNRWYKEIVPETGVYWKAIQGP